MGLSGRYWLTPDGPISVSGAEHANIAKRLMLKLEPEDFSKYAPIQRTFDGITEDEAKVHLARGVDSDAIRFLLDKRDPRNFAMGTWGWVRTDGSTFNSWFLDDETLSMVRGNTRYWRMQEPNINEDTRIDWNIMSINETYRVVVSHMLNPAVPATALIRLHELEQFRNPVSSRRSPCCAALLRAENAETLVCTACGNVWTW